MTDRINLNSDMGESYGRWQLGNDAELMRYIPTIDVACGFHGGDPHVMWRTIGPDSIHAGGPPVTPNRAAGVSARVGTCHPRGR